MKFTNSTNEMSKCELGNKESSLYHMSAPHTTWKCFAKKMLEDIREASPILETSIALRWKHRCIAWKCALIIKEMRITSHLCHAL